MPGLPSSEEFVQRAVAETGGVLAQALRGVRYRKGEGALGRTAITREPVQVPDITVPGAYDSLKDPFVFHVGGEEYKVQYLPGESDTGMFGGNSNWWGPVWMPVNALLIRALLNLYSF